MIGSENSNLVDYLLNEWLFNGVKKINKFLWAKNNYTREKKNSTEKKYHWKKIALKKNSTEKSNKLCWKNNQAHNLQAQRFSYELNCFDYSKYCIWIHVPIGYNFGLLKKYNKYM